MTYEAETGCCPRFNPEPWDRKELTWRDKLFVRDRVRAFLHIPLNFGQVVVKNRNAIEAAGASPPQPLMLADDRSLWKTDVYIAVGKDVPGADMTTMSGTFLTRVFEGPYKDAGKWMREMKAYVAASGKQLQQMYAFYTTCPRCAKAYGKNYVVMLAKV